MAELTIDPDLIRQAAATAIVTLLGDDSAALVQGLVANALQADTGSYFGGKKENYFDKALRDAVTRHVQGVITAWLNDHADEVRAVIVSRIEAEKDQMLTTVTDDVWKRMNGLR